MLESGEPLVRFYRLISRARLPQRADRSAAGTLPTRAYRYCEAVTSSTAFGWWIFPPLELALMWDGTDIYWRCDDGANWLTLAPAAQAPGFLHEFNAAAPAALHDCAPPLLTSLPEPGSLQLWTGLFVRTAPEWQLLLRAPANMPLPGGFVAYEGLLASDRWFGPMFTVLRLTRTHIPIKLRPDFPLLQAQPIPRGLHANELLSRVQVVGGLADMTVTDWDDYSRDVAGPSEVPDRRFGRYAVAERKHRTGGCPLNIEPGIAPPQRCTNQRKD